MLDFASRRTVSTSHLLVGGSCGFRTAAERRLLAPRSGQLSARKGAATFEALALSSVWFRLWYGSGTSTEGR